MIAVDRPALRYRLCRPPTMHDLLASLAPLDPQKERMVEGAPLLRGAALRSQPRVE